ncbi:Glucuronosyltransferase domain-containing protein [Phytophthora infestans]|uniref:Glucuronosyltransferase domain-containing protein n=1 Tax=Phytophthora infestans TaxID=4787 RepID=A0A833VYQ2_PHYIN|nr:Glucuronosyltransferase domain-containing protein [Phytophthora infestans]KAF4130766.1 UDP-glucoronosyl and UDP-glucosyl transferase domain-containing protein [Phytophthora infestans]
MARHGHLQSSLLRALLLLFLSLFAYATYVTSYTDILAKASASSSSEDPVEVSESAAVDPVCISDNGEFSCPAPPPAPAPAAPLDPHDRHIVFVSIAIKGHAQPLLRVASEMKERGYRVSFATHDSGREWAHAYGVPFLSAGAFPISAEDLRVKLRAMTRDASNFRGILTMFNDIYVRAARPMFDALLPQLEHNGTNANAPDILVMDIATVGAQDLAHKLKIPYILNSPSLLFDLGGAPSYVPAWGTGFSENMSLWNRCMNILFPRLLSVALTPPFMELNKMRYELDLPPFRSQHDLFKGARVILNTAFGLEHPQPLSPLVDAVGPIMPVPGGNASKLERHPLPSALLSWLDASIESTPSLRLRQRTASHRAKSTEQDLEAAAGGVVYLNLGTMAYIDAWQAQALVEGLLMGPEDSPVKVLWVLPTDQRGNLPPALPPSLVVKPPSSSLSNLEILSHPAVRLVVSHCGMVSAQEALVMGKPLLCIPFLVDQPDVAARVEDSGAGITLDKNLLSGPYVHAAVSELLTNSSYTNAARRVGSLLERAGGTTRAIDVIDAALRLGFDHLATLNLTAPWHKTALLDVWAVYAALICLLAVFVRIQWLLLYFLVSESFSLLSNLILGPPLPPSSMAEGYDDAYEDGEDAEEESDTSQPAS